MDPDPRERITEMLQSFDRGGPQPAEELLPLVYDELRALARARLAREGPGITLQATGLVHEAWLRVVGDADPGWNGRGHFFGAAARAMRRILVEDARRRARLKRGGALERVELRESALAAPAPDKDVLLVEAAARRLEAQDAQGRDRQPALLRRALERGDRAGARPLRGHDRARVALHPRLAAHRARRAGRGGAVLTGRAIFQAFG